MRIFYELSWLWKTLGIALASAAVCVACTMLAGRAMNKKVSKKTAAIIGIVGFVIAVFIIVIIVARIPMPI